MVLLHGAGLGIWWATLIAGSIGGVAWLLVAILKHWADSHYDTLRSAPYLDAQDPPQDGNNA